jgi:putative intracellular protease/amidase
MKKRVVLFGALGVLVLALVGFGGWIASLPPGAVAAAGPVPEAEATAMIEALRPPKRERPLVAVIGLNDATEVTDYVMPTGILRRADIADVLLVATNDGPVQLYPALSVEPDTTIAKFDATYPDGADYVIVPAMSRDDDPAVMAWLQQQSAKGSIVIGVCAGAKVVAAAGLLEQRRGTTHWFFLRELLQENPTVSYVADRRIVVDGNVATTTGISASIPMALTLIEAIAGRAKAETVAAEIGLATWDASHDSDAFRLTRPFVMGVMGNVLPFWRRETLAIQLEPEFDAVSLAVTADAWSRTYRSRALTVADDSAAVPDRDGIRILPDRVGAAADIGTPISAPALTMPATALDDTLEQIATRYGDVTANVVAMQLEYPHQQ